MSLIDLGGVSKEIYADLAQPSVKQVGKTLELPFRAINAALLPLQKWFIHQEHSIEETKKILAKKLEHIPEEKIVPPEPYIGVPAIQAISYCMDCEELRELFANLLASSMNVSTKNNVHPSFVEILKQLGPLDAKILRKLQLDINRNYPCCSLRIQKVSSPLDLKELTLANHFIRHSAPGIEALGNYLILDESIDVQLISASLDNIKRLGIIDITYNSSIKNKSIYLPYATNSLLVEYNNSFKNSGLSQEKELAVILGLIKLTDFGLMLYESTINLNLSSSSK